MTRFGDARSAARFLAAAGLAAALSGCLKVGDESASLAASGAISPERAAAVAEMRALAAAGDRMRYPSVFQSERMIQLAGRAEPRPTTEVEAIETELTLIAERRAASADPGEIAALEARARELRKLLLAAQTDGGMRR